MGQIKKLRGRKYSSLGKHIIGMCVLMLFLSSSVLHAESKLIDKTIKGTVVDDTTNQPIAGANVIVKGTKRELLQILMVILLLSSQTMQQH